MNPLKSSATRTRAIRTKCNSPPGEREVPVKGLPSLVGSIQPTALPLYTLHGKFATLGKPPFAENGELPFLQRPKPTSRATGETCACRRFNQARNRQSSSMCKEWEQDVFASINPTQ